METHKRSVEDTKQRILDSARVLFAEHGINGVGIREIARHAETSHSLIIRYFGSVADLATEVLKNEIEKYAKIAGPTAGKNIPEILFSIKTSMLRYLTDPEVKITMQMIARAQMDGKNPESLLPEGSERLTGKLAELIKANQTGTQTPDPDLVAMIIMGAVFSLIIVSPWLFSAIGSSPDEKRYEEVIDILVDIVARYTGLPGETVPRID